jgi:hypothetical protein
MRHVYRSMILSVALVVVLGGCGRTVKTMTYEEFRRLSPAERMKATEELTEQELGDLMTVVSEHRLDSVELARTTIGDLIERGEKIRGTIEQVPPTR